MTHRKHSMPFGAELGSDGVRFALWAPSATSVDLVCGGRRVAMPMVGQGWYRLTDEAAEAGERYGFAIDGGDDLVPDPASRFQADDAERLSSVVDPQSYSWRDASWAGRPWSETVVSEVHVGTATNDGTFAALADRLQHFKDTGITALELMPIAATPGRRTWGYDGVLPFAPNNAYGSPDDLKRLVGRAHDLGLMMFLDVVYNHFGPTGNFLHQYAKSFFTERHETPWGAGINFDGSSEASDVVREFFIQNALFWLDEYHFDGLRFDAVHAILDDSSKHFLDELAERVREKFRGRHVHLILENENNEASRLVRDGDGDAPLFNAQWDDDIHHCWHVLLTGENEGYYSDFSENAVGRLGRCLAEGFAYQGDYSANLDRVRGESTAGLPPQAFVSFLQNHDQIGNRAFGERLTALADATKLELARAVLLLAPQIPMLFMGEEWGSLAPFLFFVNFEGEPDLEEAVRKGRAKEFAKFTSFAGDIPDPTALDTFETSRLRWEDVGEAKHADVLDQTKMLLELRRREIVPMTRQGFIEATFETPGHDILEVAWRFEGNTLRLVANFGTEARPVRAEAGETLVWQSRQGADRGDLQPWTGRFTKGKAQ